MLRGVAVAIVVVVASLTGASAVSADGNEAPVAAAGLDQQVRQGSMVYLDAGGSFDPDGNITDYEWEITAPNGSTLSPECLTCVQTQFQATQNGTYDVTVTVTDNSGATRSDTMYVEAEAVDPPSVSITGPSVVENGTTASFDATETAGDRELERVIWSVDGSTVARQSVAGESAERTLDYAVDATGQQAIQARVVDQTGLSSKSVHLFDGETSSSNSTSPSSNSGGSNNDRWCSCYSPIDRIGNPGDSYRIYMHEEKVMNNGNLLFSQNDIGELTDYDGVSVQEVYSGTERETALVVDNPRLKNDIDNDTGKKGQGFTGPDFRYISTGGYEYKPKWQKESPGSTWDQTAKRYIGTKSRPETVDKPGWEYQGKSYVPTGGTYASSGQRSPGDKQVGQSTFTTDWKDSPTGGTVVDTKREFTHYTWEETRTSRKRVKSGSRVVGYEKEYGYRTETKYKTRQVCDERVKMLGGPVCVDWRDQHYIVQEQVYGVIDRQPITKPVYEYQTTTTTVQKSGSNPPWGQASNVQAHYDTSYKVKKSKPLWQKYEKKYVYDIYEYKWVRN